MEKYMDEEGNLTGEGFATAAAGLAILTEACHRRAKSKGWWDLPNGVFDRNFGEMIALMHSELSEALEAYRENDVMQEVRYEYNTVSGPQVLYTHEFVYEGGRTELGKPVGVASEFADVLIRIFDTCARLHIPLAEALLQKHAYNGTRAHRHGNKKC